MYWLTSVAAGGKGLALPRVGVSLPVYSGIWARISKYWSGMPLLSLVVFGSRLLLTECFRNKLSRSNLGLNIFLQVTVRSYTRSIYNFIFNLDNTRRAWVAHQGLLRRGQSIIRSAVHFAREKDPRFQGSTVLMEKFSLHWKGSAVWYVFSKKDPRFRSIRKMIRGLVDQIRIRGL